LAEAGSRVRRRRALLKYQPKGKVSVVLIICTLSGGTTASSSSSSSSFLCRCRPIRRSSSTTCQMMNFSAGAADFFVMLPMQIFAGGVYFRFRPESAYFRIFSIQRSAHP